MRDRKELIRHTDRLVEKLGLKIIETELDRPYGLSYRFDLSDAEKFIDYYFSDIKHTFSTLENISPKFLVLMPGSCFSWQYHNKRKEIWRIIEGPMAIKVSDTDEQPEEHIILPIGDIVQFEVGQRHRLYGLDDWGIVAEVWQHLDPNDLSDETDIVRLQDDYGRPKYRLK